ncbi:MAG: hypothetical protein IJD02_02130 [Lachnospiraceae bacterium]|nr:hypothetical protein [Lachnospiraceae bacterium]
MGNILSKGSKELKVIKKELLALEEYKEKQKKLLQQEAKIVKSIRGKEKECEDEIISTTRKRRSELEQSYDKQLGKNQAQTKKIKSDKDKQKSAKVNARIKEETKEFVSANANINSEIKTIMIREKMPYICKTDFYFSIYRPKRLGDFLKIIVTLACLLVAFPILISRFVLDSDSVWAIIVTALVIAAIAGVIYIMLGNTINSWHRNALTQIYDKKQQIRVNNKKIKKIKRKIVNDKDESGYGLEHYDKELKELSKSLSGIAKDKKKALDVYENTTKNVISGEITARYQKEIDKLNGELAKVRDEISSFEDAISRGSLNFTDKYEAFLGKEFLVPDRLDALIDIIDSGEAKDISGAINVYKVKTNQI